MKTQNKSSYALAIGLVVTLPLRAFSQLTLPTTDISDGAFNPAQNTVIDLSLATTADWDSPSPVAGRGVYDAKKWAVVFKFSSVNIPAKVTSTFKNHPSRAPVVWLVNGDVTINGVLALNGESNPTDPVGLAEPGPGGFRAGAKREPNLNLDFGAGLGPGGDYARAGYYNNPTLGYGNAQILPLIGGSGGSAAGGGGGAILIAASGSITINGRIESNGGAQAYGGSAGAVRLIANQVLGNGRIEAATVTPGRIRVEANVMSQSLSLNPVVINVSPVPITIWPPADAPSVRILSIAGQAAPLDPRANMLPNNGDDLTLQESGPVQFVIETKNLPATAIVTTMIKPRNTLPGFPLLAQAHFQSGSTALATWQLTTNVPLGHFIVQVRAVAP